MQKANKILINKYKRLFFSSFLLISLPVFAFGCNNQEYNNQPEVSQNSDISPPVSNLGDAKIIKP